MMSCISTLFLVIVSRVGIVLWWLANPLSHNLPFTKWILPGGIVFPGWLWVVLGGIFLPWTMLAYLFVFPGGVVGYEWIILLAALLIDLAGHGGSYYHRNRLSRI
jgi:hypothetical protein